MNQLQILKQDLKYLQDKWKDKWKKACKKSSPRHMEFRIDKLRALRFKRLIGKLEFKKDSVKYVEGLFL